MLDCLLDEKGLFLLSRAITLCFISTQRPLRMTKGCRIETGRAEKMFWVDIICIGWHQRWFNRKAVNLMSSLFNLWQWSEKPHCICFYIFDIHLQVAWWGAIFVGFCHRVMVDLADVGGAALLLVVVGLDDGPKPTFPHHNHKWQITRESHACDSPPSFPLRQLIDPSCKRAHCTSYIAPIIARTLFVQSFGK